MKKKIVGATIKHDQDKAPKTGDWRNAKPVVNKEKCIGCGTCVKYCPEAVMELGIMDQELRKKVVEIDYDYCKGCGVCAVECPVKAILMKKE